MWRSARVASSRSRQRRSQIARETNRKIVAIPADLTKPADAEAFVKDAHTALGRIDILVNNAGSAPGGVLDFLTEEHWAQSLQLKFMGYVRCLRNLCKSLCNDRGIISGEVDGRGWGR